MIVSPAPWPPVRAPKTLHRSWRADPAPFKYIRLPTYAPNVPPPQPPKLLVAGQAPPLSFYCCFLCDSHSTESPLHTRTAACALAGRTRARFLPSQCVPHQSVCCTEHVIEHREPWFGGLGPQVCSSCCCVLVPLAAGSPAAKAVEGEILATAAAGSSSGCGQFVPPKWRDAPLWNAAHVIQVCVGAGFEGWMGGWVWGWVCGGV